LGIQFARNEAGEHIKARIETLIGSAGAASGPTHTL
jgi:Tfp pilus assembly protein PilZ